MLMDLGIDLLILLIGNQFIKRQRQAFNSFQTVHKRNGLPRGFFLTGAQL